MSSTTRFLVGKPGDGATVAVVGDVYRFLATGEDTSGKYALFEAFVRPHTAVASPFQARLPAGSCRESIHEALRMAVSPLRPGGLLASSGWLWKYH
jgi:hypothetical protein